jgi:pantoate--beta-alanine ligase
MEIIRGLDILQRHIRQIKLEQKTIGFIPTMGALHRGHISLMDRASHCDHVVVSIFVNPLQFNSTEDLHKYPRDLDNDLSKLEGKCDLVFHPSPEAFYSEEIRLSMSFGHLEKVMEGQYRPGHFNGVAVVVARLFHLVQPDQAFFGLKDLQQFFIIRQMIQDLAFPIEIVGCPIVRESTGLAMSSRNERLSGKGKITAQNLYEGLTRCKQMLEKGEKDLNTLRQEISAYYERIDGLDLEYFEIIDDKCHILSGDHANRASYACVAAYVEGVRLIDNLSLQSQKHPHAH